MSRKSDPVIRYAVQAAQKLEEQGQCRAANDVRELARYTKRLLGREKALRARLGDDPFPTSMDIGR